MLRFTLLAAFSSLVVAACGGSVERVPDQSTNANGATPGGTAGSSSGGGGATCTAAPSCDKGDDAVASQSACPQDDVRCYSRSLCGSTVWCAHYESKCDGYPECNPGEHQVKACTPDSDCKTYAACGVTIICQKDEPPCEGPQPICDPGDKQVSSSSECLQDDAKCYSRSTCGYTIWCTGPL